MMKKLHLYLMFLTALTTANAQDFPTSSWSDLADTSWYDAGQNEFTISSAEELAGLALLVADGNSFLNKNISLDADIDLDGNLWTPIGAYPALFSGIVEGNNHTISNLWVNLPTTDYAGLFGYTAKCSFNEIHIETANIIGFDSVGTLVANLFDNGSIQNCSVVNITVVGNNNTGGLVGGMVQNSSLSKSHAIGDVTGAVQVGGLVGSGWNEIQIDESYSEGTVTGTFLVGGLIGAFPFSFGSASTLNNNYSRSAVVANDDRAGGLIGGADNALTLKNSYAAGTVSSTGDLGGVIGFLGGGIMVDNVYFDTESSGTNTAVGTGSDTGITGKTTAEMKMNEMINLLNDGNSDGPWSIDSSVNDGYPILNAVLGVLDHQIAASSVKVYPTVFESDFKVSSTLALNSFQIYSLSGSLISSGELDGQTTTVTADNLSTGVYILAIRYAEGMISKRIIKK